MKIFNNERNEKDYNSYIELLNQPYKLQSLLYHTRNIPNNINYNDIYEDEEKICVSNNNYTVRIGNSSLYLKPVNKYGFTFNKKGNSNSRLKPWYGTSNNNILNTLITVKDIFNFKFDFVEFDNTTIHKYIYEIPPTKGLLSMILCNKIKTKEDYILYYVKNSLKLKKDIINIFTNDQIVNFIERFTEHNNQFVLRNILLTCNDHIAFIKNILYINDWKNYSLLQHINGLGNFIDTLKALNKKISWTESLDEIYKMEKENTLEIKNLLNINKIWDNGVKIDLNNKDLFPSIKLSDLPF